jgi:hypothetical protein
MLQMLIIFSGIAGLIFMVGVVTQILELSVPFGFIFFVSIFLVYVGIKPDRIIYEYHPIVAIDKMHTGKVILYDDNGCMVKAPAPLSIISDDDLKSKLMVKYELISRKLVKTTTNFTIFVK